MFEHLPSVLTRSPGDVVGDALFVVDVESGTLSYVNSVAAMTFEPFSRSFAVSRIADIVPELADLSARSFTGTVAAAAGPARMEISVESLDDPFGRGDAMLVRLRPVHDALETPGSMHGSHSDRLESLWTLVVRRGLAGADQVRAILAEATRGLGFERATLARVDRGELWIEFCSDERRVGERDAIESSLGRHAIAGSGTFAVLDTAIDREFAAVAADIRSFLASAFRVGDQRWILTFASKEPRHRPFADRDWDYVDHVVEAVSRAIERRENDERIERLAYVDALTTLPNRMALHARLDEAVLEAEEAQTRAAVLFLDIDGFKGVNDTVGHRGGDLVLAEVAQRLRGTLRRDEYIGRLGGDEFAIVMPAIADRTDIESIAQRITGVLSFPFSIEGYRFSLSASIGVAIYPDDARTRDELLACADAAMYAAKDDGGSRVRFRETGVDFDDASPSYLLCYQPILEMQTGRVTSAEALVRRVHPVHGLLAPERGWSIAIDEDGRRELDRWVLREASEQARSWSAAGTPIRIDVNLAAYDARDVEALFAEEAEPGDARRLRIEIAAERFSDDADADGIQRFVERCSEIGIGFAIDDFDGTLAALPGLAHLPIDALKFGRPLVETILASRTTRAIVEGSIGVAKALGWTAIAKGVENGAQQEAFAALDCDAMQGFFVAHPMTASDFGRWLRDRGVLAEHA